MPDPFPEQDLLWLLLVVASVAVVVIAVLLGFVINVLRQIDRHAARTHTAGKQIAQNTVSLWTLEQTNRDLIAIRDAARAVGRGPRPDGGGSALSAVGDRVQGWFGGSTPSPSSGPSEDGGSS
jgi:hypothetical protein